MKLKNRAVMGALAAVALSVGMLTVATPANATVTYPEGGTFDYGVAGWPGTTWSNYYHGSRVHRSTACNTSYCQRSADAGRGAWSRASVAASLNNNTAFFYNY